MHFTLLWLDNKKVSFSNHCRDTSICRSYNGGSFMPPIIIWSRHNRFKSSHGNTLEKSNETPFGIVGNIKCLKKMKSQKQENKRPHPG